MGVPPLEAGTLQDTSARALPAVATTSVGADGAPSGVTVPFAARPLPTALWATTWTSYTVPLTRSVSRTCVSEAGTVRVSPPGWSVTVYPVSSRPPSEDGASQDTVAAVSSAVVDRCSGAPGTSGVVTASEGGEAGPWPAAFEARTVNVCRESSSSPVTVACVPDTETVAPPTAGRTSTVYPVMGLPWSAGAVQETDAPRTSAVATTSEGAAGGVRGVTGSEAGEGTLSPTRLVATTEKVTGCPRGSPVNATCGVSAGACSVRPPGEAVTV